MLEHHLGQLGLSENEIKTYLAIVDAGKSTASPISKAAKIPKSTVYGAIEELLRKGLISREETRGAALFHANDSSAFQRMIEAEKEQLKSKERSAEEIVELLRPRSKRTKGRMPRLQFCEGKQAVENLLYESLPKWREAYERLNHFVMWGYQDHTFVEQYAKWHRHAWETRSFREEIRLFSNEAGVTQQSKDRIERREIRLLPAGVQFLSSIWIHGDYLVLAMTREKPHYAFQIHDPILAGNLRAVFQLLWQFTA